MLPAVPQRRAMKVPAGSAAIMVVVAALQLSTLQGCSSIGDFDRLQEALKTDDIHGWVGQEAATHSSQPISFANLSDPERSLRDHAFPLIEPPYDRARWDAVVYEYGVKRGLRASLWSTDTSLYYQNLYKANYRSSAGRYHRLIDDVRNDIVRIDSFFDLAQRVADLDRRRESSIEAMPDLGAGERASAMARIGENALTIAWVHHALMLRYESYRYALDHLVAGEPEHIAAQADIVLAQMLQKIQAVQPIADAVTREANVVLNTAPAPPQAEPTLLGELGALGAPPALPTIDK
jgi:hypothetical protein